MQHLKEHAVEQVPHVSYLCLSTTVLLAIHEERTYVN